MLTIKTQSYNTKQENKSALQVQEYSEKNIL